MPLEQLKSQEPKPWECGRLEERLLWRAGEGPGAPLIWVHLEEASQNPCSPRILPSGQKALG